MSLNEVGHRRMHPVIGVILMLLLAFFGFLLGGVIGIYCALPFTGKSESELFSMLGNIESHPELQYVLFGSQAGATILGLIYAPYLWFRLQRIPLRTLFSGPAINWVTFFIAMAVVVTSVGVLSIVVVWNQNIHLPEAYEWLEKLAREYEEKAEIQTNVLTNMETVGALLVAMIVIAVLPAIGEELVFRGIIQNELYRGVRNIHVAIWFAAFLFSFIHLQFFGFFPRLLLGVLFGYLYHWSGNIWIPITAHFTNNGLQVLVLYLHQHKMLDYDVDSVDPAPASFVVVSTVLTIAALVYFYRRCKSIKTPSDQIL